MALTLIRLAVFCDGPWKFGRESELAKRVSTATDLGGCIESKAMCDIKEVLFFIGEAILEGFIVDFGGIPGKNGRDPCLGIRILPSKGMAGLVAAE